MTGDRISMNRRGFLGVLGAFTAALAAGRVMPASVAATSGGHVKPFKEQIDLLEILKDCRVQSYGIKHGLAGPKRVAVRYAYLPHAARTSLDDVVDKNRKGLLPVSATFTCEYDEIDVSLLGLYKEFSVMKTRDIVEVEFA